MLKQIEIDRETIKQFVADLNTIQDCVSYLLARMENYYEAHFEREKETNNETPKQQT